MSDMKTFTVRDLDRQPAKVLKACDADGAVKVKRRDGRAYIMRPEHSTERIRNLPDFAARRKAIWGDFKLTKKQSILFDKLLASDPDVRMFTPTRVLSVGCT